MLSYIYKPSISHTPLSSFSMQIFLEEEKEKEEAEGENPKENKPEKNLLQSRSMAKDNFVSRYQMFWIVLI